MDLTSCGPFKPTLWRGPCLAGKDLYKLFKRHSSCIKDHPVVFTLAESKKYYKYPKVVVQGIRTNPELPQGSKIAVGDELLDANDLDFHSFAFEMEYYYDGANEWASQRRALEADKSVDYS